MNISQKRVKEVCGLIVTILHTDDWDGEKLMKNLCMSPDMQTISQRYHNTS